MTTTTSNESADSRPTDAIYSIPGLLLATFDLAGRIRGASDPWLAALGYTWDEITQIDQLDLIHPDDLVLTIAAQHRIRDEGTLDSFTNRYRHKSGAYRRFRWSSTLDREHGRIVGWAHDVTPTTSEAAAGDSERMLPLVAESTPALIFLFDLRERRVLYVNRKITVNLGYSQEEFVAGEPNLGLALLHPDDQQVVDDAIARTARSEDGQSIDSEYRVRHKDGSYRWFWSQSLVYARDDAGTPIQVVGTLQDVTERKIREESHQLLFKANPSPIWVYDSATLHFLAVNDAATTLYGYSREEFLAMTIADIRPAEDVPEMLSDVRRHDSEQGKLWRHIAKDGRELKVRIYAADLPYMGHPARLVSVVDETEKLAALERLTSTTNTMEAVLNQSPVAIFATDAQGRVQTWNPAASAIFGVDDKAALGSELRRLFAHRSAVLNQIQSQVLSGETVESISVRAKRRDRTTAELTISARPLLARDGSITGAVAVVADVTSKNAAERELKTLNNRLEHRVAERTAELEAANQELEAFCFSVAHDLRQPLRAIDGFSRAVIEDYGDKLGEDGIALLTRVRQANMRLSELMDALLALSRVTRLSLERDWVDLAEISRQVASDQLALQGGRPVKLEIEPYMRAYGDPRLLRLLIENLLENAFKFTSQRDDAHISVATEQIEGHTVYVIRDNGAGFDMRYAHKLFQPFERLHARGEFDGHGVGLATCRRVVTRHGGQITLVGSPDAGAIALFTLQPGPGADGP